MNTNHLPLPHCFTTEFHYPPQFKGFSMNGGSVEMISSDEITQCTTLSRLIVIASLCPLCPTSFQYYALSSTSFQSKSIMHYFILFLESLIIIFMLCTWLSQCSLSIEKSKSFGASWQNPESLKFIMSISN